jgi:hypothetical protein
MDSAQVQTQTGKKVPKGNAVTYGEDEYDKQTALGEGDIEEARENWRKHAPSWATSLPDAATEDE